MAFVKPKPGDPDYDPLEYQAPPGDGGPGSLPLPAPPGPPDFAGAGIADPSHGGQGPVVGGDPPPPPPSPPNREQYRDAWMSSGVSNIDQLKSWLATNGGTLLGDNGTVRTPFGDETYDMLIGARTGQGQPGWTPTGATAVGSGAPAAGGSFQDQIRQLLLQQLKDVSGPYNPDTDPGYQTTMKAAGAQSQRSREQERAAIAERLAAQGMNIGGQGGAMDAANDRADDSARLQLSGLAGQMVQRQIESRKTQLTQMMQMALQSGDAEAARAIQLQIAQMDAELRRMGLSQQGDQFNQSLANNQYQFTKTFPSLYL